MESESVSHTASVDTLAYLNGLNDCSHPVNILIKPLSGTVYGDTFATIADAIAYVEQAKTANNYAAIWASVHKILPSAIGKTKVAKSDVAEYRYLAIDLDNIPTSGEGKVAATDDERARVKEVTDKISLALAHQNFPQPLTVYTGNGYLLLYPIRLEHTPANYAIMERLAAVMAATYSTDYCEIDTAVIKDPSRILGVVGTMNRNRAERPEQGRFAKMREVIGDYPPNEPMESTAFLAFANGFCSIHDVLDEAFAPVISPSQHATRSRRLASCFDDATDAMNRCMDFLAKCPDAVEGSNGSNPTLRAACECYRFGLSDTDAMKCLEWFNANKCNPSWTENELHHKLTDAKKKVDANGEFGSRLEISDADLSWGGLTVEPATKTPVDIDMTDVGNAVHFVSLYGDVMKYVTAWKSWYLWDGRRWARDNTAKARRLALKYVMKDMYAHAARIKDGEKQQKYTKWIMASKSGGHIDLMLSRASDLLAIAPESLDSDGNLFNVQNGTIDLRSGVLKPHDKNDLLTKISPVVFDADATAPLWDKFLARIFQDENGSFRQEIVDYLQTAIGYTMTADVSAECLWILFGNGQNGKSKFIGAISHCMGDDGGYYEKPLESILLKLHGGSQYNSDDVAKLIGVRMALVSEPEIGQQLNESKIKQLVGNGRITAMRKHEHQFTFNPTHKLWLDTNYEPKVIGQDDGIWRRLKKIEFKQTIPQNEKDYHLEEKLRAESSGILNWMLNGLSKWVANGRKLIEPAEITMATNAYRESSDTFGQFLGDCIENNCVEKATTRAVYDAYLRWADENGFKGILNSITFGKRMKERNYVSKPIQGVRYYIGCSLRTSTSEVEPSYDSRPF